MTRRPSHPLRQSTALEADDGVARGSNVDARWLPLLLGAVLAALTLAVYANALSGPFVFDDVNQILGSTWLRDSQALKKLIVAGTARPLLFITLAINYHFSQESPFSYKLVNVLLHIFAALVLYGLVRRTLLLPRFGEQFRSTAAWLAFAAAALWAVHPLGTEAVTYVIHRSESLLALFALLLLYCTLRGSQAAIGWPWYVAAVLSGWLGFASREVMVVVPAVLLLYDRIMLGGTWQQWLRGRVWLYLLLIPPLGLVLRNNSNEINTRVVLKTPAAAIAAPATGQPTRAPVQDSSGSSASHSAASDEFRRGAPSRASSWQYLLTQPGVVLHYLRLSFWPYPQCADYMWPMARNQNDFVPQSLVIIALMAATGVALWRWPAVGFLGAAFFLLLLPESSFISIEDKAAERRMYLPLAALATLVVMAIWKGINVCLQGDDEANLEARRGWLGFGLLVPALAVLSFMTVLRNDVYSSDVRFCEAIVEQVPGNSRALVNLVRALLSDNTIELNEDQRCRAALKFLLEGEKHAPDSAFIQAQLGHVRALRNELDEAEHHFRRAVELQNEPLFHLNLAIVLERKGEKTGNPRTLEEAQREYELAAAGSQARDLVMPEAHHGLGRVLAARREYRRAIAAFEETLRLESENFNAATNLISALANAGYFDEAAKVAEDYLGRAVQAHNHAEHSGNSDLAAQHAASAEQIRQRLNGLRMVQPISPQGTGP